MYYWIFQFYDVGSQNGVLNNVTEIEVKENTYNEALEVALSLLPNHVVNQRVHRLKSVIIADKK